ncbi:MAG: GNAT family N-acetyltransferase [Chloroflexota bacterium]
MALTEDHAAMRDLVEGIKPILPRRFYSHFSPNVIDVLGDDYELDSHGTYYKMGLNLPEKLADIDVSDVIALGVDDLAEVQQLYAESYPNNAFDPRMLETDCYYGVRHAGKLVAIAGIHVYSPTYRVAALGNITTHPSVRGQGLATAVTARLCQALQSAVDTIGLNVHSENKSALVCYQRLGFEQIATYEEWMVTLKS